MRPAWNHRPSVDTGRAVRLISSCSRSDALACVVPLQAHVRDRIVCLHMSRVETSNVFLPREIDLSTSMTYLVLSERIIDIETISSRRSSLLLNRTCLEPIIVTT